MRLRADWACLLVAPPPPQLYTTYKAKIDKTTGDISKLVQVGCA